jgi:hypothetical protein
MRASLIAICAVVLAAGVGACGTRSGGGSAVHEPVLARTPYMGVACRRANSIACDRVGLAVWLTRAATSVTASIEGRRVTLHTGGFGGRGPTYWEGYLQPAGLLGGALKVTPDRGRYYWQGSHPKDARVVLTVRPRGGVTRRIALSVVLSPGWG